MVLFLHGGQERSTEAVRRRHGSWWRMALMARSVAWSPEFEGAATFLMRFAVRGWNATDDPSPVRDTRHALAELAVRHRDLPVVLVGHSMGGRTACRVADEPSVAGVVALAPWLPQGEPVAPLTGRDLRVLHGSGDTWTSAAWSRDFVERAEPVASSALWTPVPGAGHFMFRRMNTWNRFVKDSVADLAGRRRRSDEQGRA